MSDSKQNELIKSTLEGIKDVVDANTVLGTPFTAENGTTIIPVTKISIGLATGGLDDFGKHTPFSDKTAPASPSSFGGGGGTGITASPVGFLVIRAGGSVEMLTVDSASNKGTVGAVVDAISDLLERSPEIADKIKTVIAKFKKKKAPRNRLKTTKKPKTPKRDKPSGINGR